MSDGHAFDVAIVGGGAIGAAVAYFLKGVEGFPGSVALIERDPTLRDSRDDALLLAPSASNSRRPKTSACRASGSNSCAA